MSTVTTGEIVFEGAKEKSRVTTKTNWRVQDKLDDGDLFVQEFTGVNLSQAWTIDCRFVGDTATVTNINGNVSNASLYRLGKIIKADYPEVREVEFKY